MSTHRAHHFVPKFLLERWHSGGDDKLSAFHWENGRLLHERYKAKHVAKAMHLYSFEGAYFSPSWTPFQADRGRCFSGIVDGISV